MNYLGSICSLIGFFLTQPTSAPPPYSFFSSFYSPSFRAEVKRAFCFKSLSDSKTKDCVLQESQPFVGGATIAQESTWGDEGGEYEDYEIHRMNE